MYKPTKRKGFNFFRSYYDVFNEIENPKDKLKFIESLLDKQFLNKEPSNLTGLVKFAWISQYNSIDQQVKGYKSKTNDPMEGSCQGGSVRVEIPPSLQVEEKGKEKGEGEYTLGHSKKSNDDKLVEKFTNWFNNQKKVHCGKLGQVRTLSETDLNNLKRLNKAYTPDDFRSAFRGLKNSSWANKNKMVTPAHFLRHENFTKYLESGFGNISVDSFDLSIPKESYMKDHGLNEFQYMQLREKYMLKHK